MKVLRLSFSLLLLFCCNSFHLSMLFVPLPLSFSLLFHVFQRNLCHGWAIPLTNNLDTKTQYVGEYTLPWPPHTHGSWWTRGRCYDHSSITQALLLMQGTIVVETNPFCLFFVSSDSVSVLFFPSFLYVVRYETPKTLMWDYLSILFQLAKIVISSALNGLSTVVGNWMCRMEHMCRIHLRHRNNHVRLKFILLLAKLWLEFIVLGPNQVGAIQPSSLKFL